MARKARREPTRPRGEGFSQQERRPRRRPVMLDFGGATAEEIAQAIFAVDKRPPDPSKRRKRPRA